MTIVIQKEVARILDELLAPPGAREALDRMRELHWQRVYGREKSNDFEEFDRLQARWPEFIGFLDVEVSV